jgi:hypothetical protein
MAFVNGVMWYQGTTGWSSFTSAGAIASGPTTTSPLSGTGTPAGPVPVTAPLASFRYRGSEHQISNQVVARDGHNLAAEKRSLRKFRTPTLARSGLPHRRGAVPSTLAGLNSPKLNCYDKPKEGIKNGSDAALSCCRGKNHHSWKECKSWDGFKSRVLPGLFNGEVFHRGIYLFRGQSSFRFPLKPSFDRWFSGERSEKKAVSERLLSFFREEIEGLTCRSYAGAGSEPSARTCTASRSSDAAAGLV